MFISNPKCRTVTFLSFSRHTCIYTENNQKQTYRLQYSSCFISYLIVILHHTINLQKGDIIYTLTDGFPDQFGGDKGKKFMIKNLKELLIKIAPLSMQEQKQKLNEVFNTWKGANEQVDDVCIIGVRV